MIFIEKDAFNLNTGKLLYAIAAVDGVVREEEYDKFIELITTLWLTTNKVDQGSVNNIKKAFEFLCNEKPKAQICFDEFIHYKKQHEQLFTKSIKELIWETACAIASEVNQKNKSELIMLVHLGKSLGMM